MYTARAFDHLVFLLYIQVSTFLYSGSTALGPILSLPSFVTFRQFLPLDILVLLFFSTSFWLKYCHTRLHLGFSAKLRIWQLPACKMEPQSGIILWLGPPTHSPPTHPQLSFFCKCCWVSPPQQSMCGVPTPFVPLIMKVCAVSPPSSTIFSVGPQCNSVPLPLCLGF